MSTKHWISLAMVAVSLGSGLALADGGAGDQFQRSYDAEAAGKAQDALTALDSLPAPQRDGYVAQLRRGWLLYKLGKQLFRIFRVWRGDYIKSCSLNVIGVEVYCIFYSVDQYECTSAFRSWTT